MRLRNVLVRIDECWTMNANEILELAVSKSIPSFSILHSITLIDNNTMCFQYRKTEDGNLS